MNECSHLEEAYQKWNQLNHEEDKVDLFYSLCRDDQDEFFLRIGYNEQLSILERATNIQARSWLRSLEPDDLADLIQEAPVEKRSDYLSLIDSKTKNEVSALLAYRDDVAGGLMNTRFARLRPYMSVDEALKYLRVQRKVETIYYAYVIDSENHLKGVVSLRQLFVENPVSLIDDIMIKGPNLVVIQEGMDEEEVARIFSQWSFVAIPVIDSQGFMKGILTVDDVVQVVQDVATEDIHKLGGQSALDAPYFQSGFFELIKKRAGWLMVLLIGEMFTASAMGNYEGQIQKAVVLALFIPMIISSGGNSGSQASTLIIRAMALGEVRLRDWWKILVRELSSGLLLGLILGVLGILRIILWPDHETLYGVHYVTIAIVVGVSLIGVVTLGTFTGSMLPFILRKFKLDPATASAPFVATIVDVAGLVIYFTVANIFLRGVLL